MATASARGLQLLLDILGQNLTQFDTPLVERVDVPDGAFGEGQVLVVGDQGSQGGGGDLLSQDGGGGTVSKESLVRHQVVGSTFGLDLFRGLTDHQGLRLGKEVGGKHALVLAVLDGVVRLGSHDEVGGDELGALVQQLEEAVLGIGGRLTEKDGASGVLDVFTGASDGLAVALHGELLQVGRETVEVLVEGGHQVSLGAKEIAVPDAQQTTNNGDVLLQRGLAEVLVHGVGTSQELVEVVVSNVQGDGETNGTPDGVTTTHPRFETEHVLLVNTKLGDLRLVGRESHKVLGDMGLVLGGLEEPFLRRVGVGGSFSGSESLGGNQEKSGFGVRVLEGFGNVSSVNVGDKVQLHIGMTIGLQGLSDHNRTTRVATLVPMWALRRFRAKKKKKTYRSEPPIPMLTMVLIFLPE